VKPACDLCGSASKDRTLVMMASMILLIAATALMSGAKRLDILPQTGHVMQPASVMPASRSFPPVQMQESPAWASGEEEDKVRGLAKLIPALQTNDDGTKAWLAQLGEETWDEAAAVLVDITRKEEAKASKAPWLADMDAATWDAVAGKVSQVTLGCANVGQGSDSSQQHCA